MNKRLLVGMLSAFMAMVPWAGHAAQTIDAPHVNVDSNGGTEDCTYCHFANYQPSDCTRCHANNAAPYGDGTAPLVQTHKNLNCQACHNPHVSLQPTGIAGSFTGVTADTPSVGMTTLTGVTPTPDISWAEKTGTGRGMILWVHDGTESASYEVKGIDAANGTVAVKGSVPATSVGSFDLRRGQLIGKKVSKTASSYRQGDLSVEFPSQGSSSIFIDTQHGTSPTGICQVCHTATQHWKSDGSLADHNADKACTQCHKHSAGFLVTGCTACHPGADPDGAPRIPAELASPSTGSQTAGQHAVHATAAGNGSTVGYSFPCVTCHTGTGMDRINAPTNPVKGDGIQIGFSWSKYMGYLTSYNGQATVDGVGSHSHYVGTNHTTVTNTGAVGNGSLVCSNVYCHSNGAAVRLNCNTPTTNTSPAWDGSSADPQGDTQKCNNCHGFTKDYTNTMMTGRHETHVKIQGYPCYVCHANTTAAGPGGVGIVISNTTNHANGVYDIIGGTYQGSPVTVTYDKTLRKCSTATCHGARTWATNPTVETETCPSVPCTGDAMVNIDPTLAYQVQNLDPNTVMVTDVSYDPDRVDPVKSTCLGGGFNGVDGYIKFNILDTKVGNYTTNAPLNGLTTPAAPVVRTYRNSDNVLDITADPNAPRVWINYAAIDNAPTSLANSKVADTANDGVSWSGWFAHVMTPLDMTKTNAHPILEFTTSAVRTGTNTCTLTITDDTLDPDVNDPAKQTYFGGAHDGSNGRARIQFLSTADGVDTGIKSIPFGSTTPLHTAVSTTVYGAAGKGIWYQYFVRDNHAVNATANAKQKSYTIYSGWKRIVLP